MCASNCYPSGFDIVLVKGHHIFMFGSLFGGQRGQILHVNSPPKAAGEQASAARALAKTLTARAGRAATGPQRTDGIDGPMRSDRGMKTITGFDAAPPGTYETYRKIAHYPTVYTTLVKRYSPILSNGWGWRLRNKETGKQKWIDEAKAQFDPIRIPLLKQTLYGVDYGWQPQETVFKANGKRWNVDDIKPLLVDNTSYLADDAGRIVGIRNLGQVGDPVDLPLSQCFIYVNDPEARDPFGSPLMENDRIIWSEADQVRQKMARWFGKVAGVIPILHYPIGTSLNRSGAYWPNEWIARDIAHDAQDGRPILIPNAFAAMIGKAANLPAASEMFKTALQCAGLSDWVLSFAQPDGPDRARGFIEAMVNYDALLVRGCGMPERSVLPAQRSSRQDAQTHDESADVVSELTYADLCMQFCQQVVNPWALLNFGPDAVDQIVCEAPPISKQNSRTLEKIVIALLSQKSTAVRAAKIIGLPDALEDLHVPVIEALADTWENDPWDTDTESLPPASVAGNKMLDRLKNSVAKKNGDGNMNGNGGH